MPTIPPAPLDPAQLELSLAPVRFQPDAAPRRLPVRRRAGLGAASISSRAGCAWAARPRSSRAGCERSRSGSTAYC